MNLLDVQNVEFQSRSQKIVKGISLKIERGTTTALIGHSGSGKSTLLKLMDGLLVPSAGKILFEGRDIQTMNRAQNLEFRQKCSFVFQDSALWANQNIVQNLSLPLQIHFPQMTSEERMFTIHSICAMVGYDRDLNLRPVDLSTGEQKRIAFARAMICGPEVLFLDECTESLDRKGSAIIMDLLHNFINQGNTVIYISHNSTFIAEFPGTMYHIENGLIQGEPV